MKGNAEIVSIGNLHLPLRSQILMKWQYIHSAVQKRESYSSLVMLLMVISSNYHLAQRNLTLTAVHVLVELFPYSRHSPNVDRRRSGTISIRNSAQARNL